MLRVTECRETGSNTVRPQEAEQQQASGQGSGGAAIGHDPADRVRSHSAPAAPRDPGGPAEACSVARRQAGGPRRGPSLHQEPCRRACTRPWRDARSKTRLRGWAAAPGRISGHSRTSNSPWPLASGGPACLGPDRDAHHRRLGGRRRPGATPVCLCSLEPAHSSRNAHRFRGIPQAAQRIPARGRFRRRRSPKRASSRTLGFLNHSE